MNKVETDPDYGLQIFALLIVVIFGQFGGFSVRLIRGLNFGKSWGLCRNIKIKGCCNCLICKKLTIPPLIGNIVFGCIARNFIQESLIAYYPDKWATQIRSFCLGVILLRGGMKITFSGQGFPVIILVLLPPTVELIVVALIAVPMLDMPFSMSLTLGSVVSAVSAAVLVPLLVNLQVRGYGQKKSICSSILAASTFNNVTTILIFSVFAAIALKEAGIGGDVSIADVILFIIYQVLGGLAVGIVVGFLAKFIKNFSVNWKGLIQVGFIVACMVVAEIYKFPESRFVAIISFGYICARQWDQTPDKPLANFWTILAPFLFGTIGGALQFSQISAGLIGQSIIIVLVGITMRSISVVIFLSFVCKYTLKERIFYSLSWIPKATVQAALGGYILTIAQTENLGQEYIDYGIAILTISVISVIICSPLGAIAVVTFGDKLLEKEDIAAHMIPKLAKQQQMSYQLPASKAQRFWDIIRIHFDDFVQRSKENEQNVKIQFLLDENEKQKRLSDFRTCLSFLKVYKQSMLEGKMIILEDPEFVQYKKNLSMAEGLEYASAFSSLVDLGKMK